MKGYTETMKDMVTLLPEIVENGVDSENYRAFKKGTDDIISMAVQQLISDSGESRFFGNFVGKTNRIASYAINRPVHHQVTNTGITFLYNPILLVQKEYSIKHVGVLIAKEVCHLVAKHYLLQIELRDCHPWIITKLACELEASEMMRNSNIQLIDDLWTCNKLNSMFEINLVPKEAKEMAKELHELMYENEEFAEFIENSMDPDLYVEGDEDPLLIGDMIKYIVIETCTENRGKLPGGLAGLIEVMTAPPVITWEQELASFLGTVAADHKPTVFRRNRRQPDRIDLKGQLRDKEIELVVAIDTSGSMSDEIIAKCMNEIFALADMLNGSITIVECDSEINRTYEAQSSDEVNPEVMGRGGTAFKPVFYWMEDERKDDAVLIYLTDGYGESYLGNVANTHQGTVWVLTERKDDLSLKNENLPKNSLVLSLTNK